VKTVEVIEPLTGDIKIVDKRTGRIVATRRAMKPHGKKALATQLAESRRLGDEIITAARSVVASYRHLDLAHLESSIKRLQELVGVDHEATDG
jgi:hypothetical protein